MSDRAEEVASEVVRRLSDRLHPLEFSDTVQSLCCQAIIAALRAYAEEVRREEREAWLDYAALLSAELTEVSGLAWAHGWRSSRVEQGKALRRRLGFATDEDYAAAIRARGEKG